MIKIKNKAYKKMFAYANEVGDSEIGGLILGELDYAGDVIVKDIMILKQKISGSEFEITDEAMMDLTKTATPKKLKQIIGWWHSHNKFSAFFSGPDDMTFQRLCNLTGYCLGIVISKKDEKDNIRTRLDFRINDGFISIDNIEVDIDKEAEGFSFSPTQIIKDIKEMVGEMEVKYLCPHCNGSGSVTKKKLDKYDNYIVEDQECLEHIKVENDEVKYIG